MKIKNKVFLAGMLVLGCVLFSPQGFAKDQSGGFFAGPLSDTAETIQKKADLEQAKKDLPPPKPDAPQREPAEEEKPLSFKQWLNKLFNRK